MRFCLLIRNALDGCGRILLFHVHSMVRSGAISVCGELVALVGYIPGVEIKTDANRRRVDLHVK